MEFKIDNEQDILNADIRKAAIAHFKSAYNIERKKEAIKREEVYKDQAKKYVIEAFSKESIDQNVKQEIYNRTSNISMARKIINKKANVYKDGAVRIANYPEYQEDVDKIVDYLDFNTVMKEVNRKNENHYNVIVSCLPYKENDEWYLKLKSYSPDKYDVIVSATDPEEAIVYVFSYEEIIIDKSADLQNAGVRGGSRDESFSSKVTFYIFWSESYHFTTDDKGEIIPGKQGEDLLNPIQEIPIVDFSKLKDNKFFNINGSDIVDGSVLINLLLTDMYYISKFQGMGIGYMFGKGIPQNLKIGPSSFVTVQMEVGDPTPAMGFASSNPPIEMHISQIEQAISLLLSTNNLDAGTVSGKLDVSSAASGIHEIIKKAENLDDIEDQREVYRDNEPELFEIIFKWIEQFRNLDPSMGYFCDELAEIKPVPEDFEVSLRFNQPAVILSEMEKLNVIEKRKDLGLDTPEDSLKRDNPDLSEEEIKLKLEKLGVNNGKQGDLQVESERPNGQED